MSIFSAINGHRVSEGLPSLYYDGTLWDLAAIRAQECSILLSGTRPDGSNWDTVFSEGRWSFAGENRLYGTQDFTADQMVAVWMNSPSHRETLLSPNCTHCGVGICYTENRMYIVALFAG